MSTSSCHHNHPDHSEEIARMNRMAGQVEGVKKMISERRYCPEIITQLRAVQAAARSIEARILQRHLQSCMKDAFLANDPSASEEKIDELITLFKKLS